MPEPVDQGLPEWLDEPLRLIEAMSADALETFAGIVSKEENLAALTLLPKITSEALDLPIVDAIKAISFLQWYSSRREDDDEFRTSFAESVAASGHAKDLTKRIDTLAQAVCFRIGAKALDLYLRSPNSNLEVKITTDLRPVWDPDHDYKELPAAATIIHTLQLEYWPIGAREPVTTFISVDPAELHRITVVAAQALTKQQTLEQLAANASVRLVQVGEQE